MKVLATKPGRLEVLNPNEPLFLTGHGANLIEWPTAREIQRVSEHLARIQQVGIRAEADGDYFMSGDVAYQIQEIIRATRELVKRTQRAKG